MGKTANLSQRGPGPNTAASTSLDEEVRRAEVMMDDLGLSRAQWTRSVDTEANLRPVDVEALELNRASNIPGTAEYKAARQNRRGVSAWANLAASAVEDEETEDSAGGQAHRAALSATIQRGSPGPAAARGGRVQRGGRGGGVIGTRGRSDRHVLPSDAEPPPHRRPINVTGFDGRTTTINSPRGRRGRGGRDVTPANIPEASPSVGKALQRGRTPTKRGRRGISEAPLPTVPQTPTKAGQKQQLGSSKKKESSAGGRIAPALSAPPTFSGRLASQAEFMASFYRIFAPNNQRSGATGDPFVEQRAVATSEVNETGPARRTESTRIIEATIWAQDVQATPSSSALAQEPPQDLGPESTCIETTTHTEPQVPVDERPSTPKSGASSHRSGVEKSASFHTEEEPADDLINLEEPKVQSQESQESQESVFSYEHTRARIREQLSKARLALTTVSSLPPDGMVAQWVAAAKEKVTDLEQQLASLPVTDLSATSTGQTPPGLGQHQGPQADQRPAGWIEQLTEQLNTPVSTHQSPNLPHQGYQHRQLEDEHDPTIFEPAQVDHGLLRQPKASPSSPTSSLNSTQALDGSAVSIPAGKDRSGDRQCSLEETADFPDSTYSALETRSLALTVENLSLLEQKACSGLTIERVETEALETQLNDRQGRLTPYDDAGSLASGSLRSRLAKVDASSIASVTAGATRPATQTLAAEGKGQRQHSSGLQSFTHQNAFKRPTVVASAASNEVPLQSVCSSDTPRRVMHETAEIRSSVTATAVQPRGSSSALSGQNAQPRVRMRDTPNLPLSIITQQYARNPSSVHPRDSSRVVGARQVLGRVAEASVNAEIIAEALESGTVVHSSGIFGTGSRWATPERTTSQPAVTAAQKPTVLSNAINPSNVLVSGSRWATPVSPAQMSRAPASDAPRPSIGGTRRPTVLSETTNVPNVFGSGSRWAAPENNALQSGIVRAQEPAPLSDTTNVVTAQKKSSTNDSLNDEDEIRRLAELEKPLGQHFQNYNARRGVIRHVSPLVAGEPPVSSSTDHGAAVRLQYERHARGADRLSIERQTSHSTNDENSHLSRQGRRLAGQAEAHDSIGKPTATSSSRRGDASRT